MVEGAAKGPLNLFLLTHLNPSPYHRARAARYLSRTDAAD